MTENIYGLTLLRNGVKYDYSFKESLLSLAPITKEICIALGKGEDNTEEELLELKDKIQLHLVPTVWDDNLKEGAIILSQQTNIALNKLKELYQNQNDAWGFYLQCDEVIHEEDYDLFKEDFKKAEESGCDAISFRYLHFWMNHHSIAINKKWYPQEIRAIKLNTPIESWGDAQSFKNYTKIYESNARIFHYGHVREEDKYKDKKRDILTLYHEKNKLPKYQKREKKFDDLTECLSFWGKHPKVMKERIERLGDLWELDPVDSLYLVGDKNQIKDEFIKKINAHKTFVVDKVSLVPKEFQKDKMVILESNFLNKLFNPSKVPSQMRSKLARPWPSEFVFALKLFEKNIGLK